MRTKFLAVVLFVGVISLTLSLIRGQDKLGTPAAKEVPKTPVAPAPVVQQSAPIPLAPARDLSHLTGQAQQFLHTGQRGPTGSFACTG